MIVKAIAYALVLPTSPVSANPSAASILPLEGNIGPVVQIEYAGRPVKAVIDTGSPISLTSSDFFGSVLSGITDPAAKRFAEQSGGLLGSLRLGSLKFTAALRKLDGDAMKRIKGYWGADIVLGMDALVNTKMGLDVAAKRVVFWPAEVDAQSASELWFNRDLALEEGAPVRWLRRGCVAYRPGPDGTMQVFKATRASGAVRYLGGEAEDDGMLRIVASFDGAGAPMLFDTASPLSSLSAALGESLSNPKVLAREPVGWIDGIDQADRIAIRAANINGLTVPLAQGVYVSERAPDVIGLDIIRQLRVFIDFRRRSVMAARTEKDPSSLPAFATVHLKDGSKKIVYPGSQALLENVAWVEAPEESVTVKPAAGTYVLVDFPSPSGK